VISLEGCSVSIADESIKKRFCFVLSTSYRNYFLVANDQYEMACWIESLKYACQAQNADNAYSSVNVGLFNSLNDILAAHDKAKKSVK